MKKIDLKVTLADGIKFGIKNFPSLIVMIILYVLTVWIPYLNVGTTIGLYRAIIDISKGKVINPLSIFNGENFNQMGEFFLLTGLVNLGKGIAATFMIIPAIVVGIAWKYATYILLEYKKTSTDAIHLSEKVTYGEKSTIFGIQILYWLVFGIVGFIFSLIPVVGKFFAVIIFMLGAAVYVAILSVMYRHFGAKVAAELGISSEDTAAPAAEKIPAAPAE